MTDKKKNLLFNFFNNPPSWKELVVDLLAFALTVSIAFLQDWRAADIVWAAWFSSLLMGLSFFLLVIFKLMWDKSKGIHLKEEEGSGPGCLGSATMFFLDLDDFKGVNDKYGHMVGDEILIHISKIIKEMIRAEDVAARFGGDEFVIMLGHTDKAGANAVATKLVNAINSQPLKINNKFDNEYRFGLSAGIASYPIDASDPEELVEKADIALYHAKKIGKNNVFCYEHSKEDENIPKNRRIADRYDCKLEEIYFNLLNSKNKYKAFLKNISESGFQIQTPFINPSMQGNWMEIEINNEIVNPFHITGKMLYSKKHDFGYIAGFKIDNLHRDEEKISAFIDVQKRKAI